MLLITLNLELWLGNQEWAKYGCLLTAFVIPVICCSDWIISLFVLQLTSATVHEDGYELSLTVNFALRGTKDPFVGKPMGVSRDFLSSYTTGRKSSLRSYGSMDSLSEILTHVSHVVLRSHGYVQCLAASGQSTARSGKKKSARRTKKKTKTSKQSKALEDELSVGSTSHCNDILTD